MRICEMAYGKVRKTPYGMFDCGECPLMDAGCDVDTSIEATQLIDGIVSKLQDMADKIDQRYEKGEIK